MASIIPGYEYDIFISYRQKDNKHNGWVTEFVNNLRGELEGTFKEDISIYFDENTNDGLRETHNIDKSLEAKLKCLIFIPIISQTYCDPHSFAWQHEFCVFNKLSKEDLFGRDIRLSSGNVTSRILPVKIHDLEAEDNLLLENELGGKLRPIEFIYKEAGVNRPLKPTDSRIDNQNKTDYSNQVNKSANAIKELIGSLKKSLSTISASPGIDEQGKQSRENKLKGKITWFKFLVFLFSVIIFTFTAQFLYKYFFSANGSKEEHRKNITANSVAFVWYTKAEYRLTQENKNDLDSCIFFLKKAIDADSLFALAHAKLSLAYSYKNYFIDTKGGYIEKAFVEAEKSLYLNPNLAEGYFAKAYSTWNFQNKFPHEKIIREFKKAIALKPEMADAYHQLGVVYLHVGLMNEAFDSYRKALEISPDNKNFALDLASAYLYTGMKTDLEKMIDLFKQMPDHIISTFRASNLAIALMTLDRFKEAENILTAEIKKDSSDLFINSAFAIFLAKKGDRTGALKKIEFCEKSNLNTGHFHHAVYNLAVANAIMGDYEKSVRELTWVADNGFPNYPFFRDDPLLKSLEQNASYNELLKKLKTSWNKYIQVANE